MNVPTTITWSTFSLLLILLIYSNTISARGGIPQGTRLAPLLFAILVNNLSAEWRNRLKYVDDTSVFEIIPRLSLSYLPFVAANINSFSL